MVVEMIRHSWWLFCRFWSGKWWFSIDSGDPYCQCIHYIRLLGDCYSSL